MSIVYSVPGEHWVFVVGPSALVAVDPSTPADVVETLSSLVVGAGATVERIVGAIPLMDDERSFAVVAGPLDTSAQECSLTAVVRGTAAVDIHSVGGSRRFSAHGTLPWLLAEFGSVVAVTMASADTEARGVAVRSPDAVPLESPVARGQSLVWSLAPLDLARDDEKQRWNDDTVVVRRRGDRRRGSPPIEAAPPEPVTRGNPYTLRFTSGETYELNDVIIVGRRPRGDRIRDGSATLVTVPSPSKEVSGTHVRIEAAGDTVTVTDEHSTNGTLVTPSGSERLKVRPGDSLTLGGRARVELGDGIIIEIIPPDER